MMKTSEILFECAVPIPILENKIPIVSNTFQGPIKTIGSDENTF